MEKLTELTESPLQTPEAVLAGIMRRIGTPGATAGAKATPPPMGTEERGRGVLAVETLSAGPFTDVVAWLLALDALRPAPPYVLALVSLLERIGDGTADDSDRQRLAAWLPNGIFNARLVHRRDPAAGAALLAELLPRETTT